jgi:cell division protein FtsQ
MRPLGPPERPVSHARHGLRAAPPLTAARAPAAAGRIEPVLTRAPAAPPAFDEPSIGPQAQAFAAPPDDTDDWDAVAASFIPARRLAAGAPIPPAAPAPAPEAEPPASAAEGWLFRRIRPDARAAARARLLRTPPAVRRADPRDPAPSRLAYRMERLWLTPLFRVFLRMGLPVLAVLAVALVWLGDEGRRDALARKFADLRLQFESRPEFMVRLMSIDGASQPVADAVRAMLPVTLPASSFRIDLEAFRAAIEQVDAVDSAEVKVRSGGVLAVTVTERKPAVLWRTASSLEMLDATGHRVATLLDRAARPDLPVIAGEGAEGAVPEALAILAAAGPILPRVRGLVRQGDRRWDLVLDRDQRVLLPALDPVTAVERLIAIDAAEELFERDISAVDLRNGDRPTVRLTGHAVAEMQKLTESVTKVSGQ